MNLKLKQKRKKTVISEIQEIPALANALNDAVDRNKLIDSHNYTADTKLAEFYLGCGFHDFYHIMFYPDKSMVPVFAMKLEEFITCNYGVNNDSVKEYLTRIIGNEAFRRNDYYHNVFKRHIGFKYCCFSDSDSFMDYISFGNYFIEDSNGNRLVVHIPDFEMYKSFNGGISNNLKIELLGNSNITGCRETLLSFINDAGVKLGGNLRTPGYAVNSMGLPVKIENEAWDSLKIPAELKKDIKFHITDFISHLDKFREADVKPSRGIIVSGPPGNGKTMLARILCSNTDTAFFIVNPEDFNRNNGNTWLEDLYTTASANAPSIVLIEDADIFLQKRMINFQASKLSDFLNVIDGIRQNSGIITILTCNNPELLDEAVKNRPKRFDVIIDFPNPAAEQRREILVDKIEKHMKPGDTDLIEEASERFEGFSGAHLCEFGERLIMSKIYKGREYIDREIFDEELQKYGFKPSLKKPIGIR